MSNVSKVVLVFLFLFTSFYYASANTNDLYRYKGNIIIEVTHHNESYGVENGAKNVGIKYKAYLDMTSENNQKIIFYKSKHVKELEIQRKGKELIVFYNKKKVYDSKTMTKKDFSNLITKYPIYKYPYTITDFLYYSGGESEYFPTSILDSALVSESDKGYYQSEGDYVSDHKWKNGVPYKIWQGHMYEDIITEYLDEDGWIKK